MTLATPSTCLSLGLYLTRKYIDVININTPLPLIFFSRLDNNLLKNTLSITFTNKSSVTMDPNQQQQQQQQPQGNDQNEDYLDKGMLIPLPLITFKRMTDCGVNSPRLRRDEVRPRKNRPRQDAQHKREDHRWCS